MDTLVPFFEKFRINKLKLYESEHWIWSLRPNQITLGASVLTIKRECTSFSQLSSKEFEDMKNVIDKIENTLYTTFQYTKINYLMLMMFDKQVHFHILPRYKNKINVVGVEWSDDDYPKIPNLVDDYYDEDICMLILKEIKETLTK